MFLFQNWYGKFQTMILSSRANFSPVRSLAAWLIITFLFPSMLDAKEPKGANEGETVADAAVPENSAMAEIRDVPGLPRVLLIGDSISIGYTLPVRKLL